MLGHRRRPFAQVGEGGLDRQLVALELAVDRVLLQGLDVQHAVLLLAEPRAHVGDLLFLVADVAIVGLVALERLIALDLEPREPILEGLDRRVGPVLLRVRHVGRRAAELRRHLDELPFRAADLLAVAAQALVGVLEVLVEDVDLLVDVDDLRPPEVPPQAVLGGLHLRLEDAELIGVERVNALVGVRLVVVLDVDVGERVDQVRRALRVAPEVADLEHVRAGRRRDGKRQLHLADHLGHADAGLGLDPDADDRLLEHLPALHDLRLAGDHVRVEGHVDAAGRRLRRCELHRLTDLHQHLRGGAPRPRPQHRHQGRRQEHQQEDADDQATVLEDRVEEAPRGQGRRAGHSVRREQRRGFGQGLEGCHRVPPTARANTPRRRAAAPESTRARTHRRRHPCRRSTSPGRRRRRSGAAGRALARRARRPAPCRRGPR